MSASKGAGLIVAASIGAVEALKDQLGVCRWNYALRLLQQRAKTSVQTYYQMRILTNYKSSSCSSGNKMMAARAHVGKIKRTEQSLNRVMDLSCWGPSTLRF